MSGALYVFTGKATSWHFESGTVQATAAPVRPKSTLDLTTCEIGNATMACLVQLKRL